MRGWLEVRKAWRGYLWIIYSWQEEVDDGCGKTKLVTKFKLGFIPPEKDGKQTWFLGSKVFGERPDDEKTPDDKKPQPEAGDAGSSGLLEANEITNSDGEKEEFTVMTFQGDASSGTLTEGDKPPGTPGSGKKTGKK